MDSKGAIELGAKVMGLQALMIAYATDGRTPLQSAEYREIYSDVTIDLEEAKYANPNPHKSLEVFMAFCKLQDMSTYASRRAYVQELYSDVLLDLKRIQRHAPSSKNWSKANEALADELVPVRAQWLKAKNFIYSTTPDYENSIKESISSVESSLMVLLDEPNGTLGKIIKRANLDADIERLITQAYGYASNKDFVRHGGTVASGLSKAEAEFFLDFSAGSIVYITSRLKIKR
ncbi:hypothetical protein HX871_26450 [Pseudomonas reactans]|uniref:Uncharacterized protein n=1 Tax=Pseudomonas reactans TaxID=117680 RepID=A0ABX2R1M7_9PSED|nr:hypothetical protein [Pseudomonas reactans]NWA42549.1 hypothetical protein [Pseudomonas reactans]NWD97975.1 hypothetical protein [Pseudomonas reactans]